jgi:two-component system, chemotaxis family, protein-glutamate methylesterase/glutaminase
MSALAHGSSSAGPVTDPIRVMIVDDSVVIRGLLGRWIDEAPGLAVVASHRNGRLAVDDMVRSNPDVVILDVEMPEMDGLTALPLILEKKRDVVVVVASTLTRRNAEISLKALSLGATDYVPKPEGNAGVSTSSDFKRELIEKVLNLGQRSLSKIAGRGVATPLAQPRAGIKLTTAHPTPATGQPATPARAGRPHAFTIRAYSKARPKILALGSSTGGPQALNAVFAEIGSSIGQVPVVLTQHMPATFTAILAEHICKTAGRVAAEGNDGELLKPGRIYVAPGGKHMILVRQGADVAIRLTDGPAVNFCKPAVDPLFQSVAQIYGDAALAIVLTGMGSDGAEGVREIGKAGGSVIAQDEDTSVVWGMPGAAAHTGMCSDVLPLPEIGRKVSRILLGGRP